MALRKVVLIGENNLRKKSKPVKDFDESLWELLDDMKETMYENDGMGLAAPQVGVLRRIFIVSTDEGYFECINPQIVSCSGSQIGEEGCLSVKGKYGTVERPMCVTVTAYDRYGKKFKFVGKDFLAKSFYKK